MYKKDLNAHERRIIKNLRKNTVLEKVGERYILHANECEDDDELKKAYSVASKLYGEKNVTVLGLHSRKTLSTIGGIKT